MTPFAPFRRAAASLSTCISSNLAALSAKFNTVRENSRDFITGLTADAAMAPAARRVDEFKIVAGMGALVTGAVELGPLSFFTTAPAAAVPTLEGMRDIAEHGHALREMAAVAKDQMTLRL